MQNPRETSLWAYACICYLLFVYNINAWRYSLVLFILAVVQLPPAFMFLSHMQFLWMNRHGFPSLARKFSAIFSTSFWWISNHLFLYLLHFLESSVIKQLPPSKHAAKFSANFDCRVHFYSPPAACRGADKGLTREPMTFSSNTNIQVCNGLHNAVPPRWKVQARKKWDEKSCAFQGAAPLALEMTAKTQ